MAIYKNQFNHNPKGGFAKPIGVSGKNQGLSQSAAQQKLNNSSLTRDLSGTRSIGNIAGSASGQIDNGFSNSKYTFVPKKSSQQNSNNPVAQDQFSAETFIENINTKTQELKSTLPIQNYGKANSQPQNIQGTRSQQVESLVQATKESITSQKQQAVESIRSQKQVALDSRDVPKPIGASDQNANTSILDSTKGDSNVKSFKAIQKSSESVEHVTTSEIANAIITYFQSDLKTSSGIKLAKENTSYEVYFAIDKSEKKVFDYLLKVKDLAERRKWFNFVIIDRGQNIYPSVLTLNYQVPKNRFSIDKELYFFARFNVGKASKILKKIDFYDTTANVGTPDASKFDVEKILVFYKESDKSDQPFLTKEDYEKSLKPEDKVTENSSGAIANEGTLSDQNPVGEKDKKLQEDSQKISTEINASKSDSKVAADDRSTNKAIIGVGASGGSAIAIGAGASVIAVGAGARSKDDVVTLENLIDHKNRREIPNFRSSSVVEKIDSIDGSLDKNSDITLTNQGLIKQVETVGIGDNKAKAIGATDLKITGLKDSEAVLSNIESENQERLQNQIDDELVTGAKVTQVDYIPRKITPNIVSKIETTSDSDVEASSDSFAIDKDNTGYSEIANNNKVGNLRQIQGFDRNQPDSRIDSAQRFQSPNFRRQIAVGVSNPTEYGGANVVPFKRGISNPNFANIPRSRNNITSISSNSLSPYSLTTAGATGNETYFGGSTFGAFGQDVSAGLLLSPIAFLPWRSDISFPDFQRVDAIMLNREGGIANDDAAAVIFSQSGFSIRRQNQSLNESGSTPEDDQNRALLLSRINTNGGIAGDNNGIASGGFGGGNNGNGKPRKLIAGGFEPDDNIEKSNLIGVLATNPQLEGETYEDYIYRLNSQELNDLVNSNLLPVDENSSDLDDYSKLVYNSDNQKLRQMVSDGSKLPPRQRFGSSLKDSWDREDLRNIKKNISESKYTDRMQNPIGKFRQAYDNLSNRKDISPVNRVRRAGIDAFTKKGYEELKKKIVVGFLGFMVSILPWLLIPALIFGFMAGAIAIECLPEKTMQRVLTRPLDGVISAAFDASQGKVIEAVVGATGTVVGTGATLVGVDVIPPPGYFAKWVASLPGCAKLNNCDNPTIGSTAGGNVECFAKQLAGKSDNDKVTLWKAQGGVSQSKDMTVATAKEILSYVGKEGITTETAAWVISLATTESGGGNWDLAGGVGNTCYGIIQVCNNAAGGNTYSAFTREALGSVPSVSEFRSNHLMQMKVANYAYKEKLKIGRTAPAFKDKSDVYTASSFWLGSCSRNIQTATLDQINGRECGGGVPGKDYGESADRNYKIITCAGGVTTAYVETRQQDQTNKYWSEVFGFPVLAKIGENISKPVLTGLKTFDDRILAFNKVMEGKISVEAQASQSTGSGANAKVAALFASGELTSQSSNDAQLFANGQFDSKLSELIVKLYEAGFKIKGGPRNLRNNAGDSKTSQHGKGQAYDIAEIGKKGGTMYNIKSINNQPDLPIVKEFTDAIKNSGLLKGNQLIGPATWKTKGHVLMNSADAGSNHEDHIHVGIDSNATGKDIGSASGASTTSSECSCSDGGSSGSIGTASGNGTVSSGGVFTPEVRAFLDTIANWEAEGDKLGIGGYNSGNFKANFFDSTKYATSFPTIDSPGNGGRYQVRPVFDKKEADTFLSRAGITEKIVGFDAKNQDLFALGRFYYRAIETNKENKKIQELLENNFERAAGIASAEWASAPVIAGYTHADKKQSKADLAKYKAYYDQRLAVYKKISWFDITNIFGGIKAEAQSETTVADKRKKLGELFSQKYISQTNVVKTDDASGYTSKFDDNMIGFMYDLYYKAGITWIGGPFSHSRNGGDHGRGDAMDFWAFGYVADIEGKKSPIKGYTGPVELYPANGGDPGQGNIVDPRMYRMIDTTSSNSSVKTKTLEIFKKVVDTAYSTGLVKQYGRGQKYGDTGFPNVYGHDELLKVYDKTKMKGHSDGSVLPLKGSPPNNGHITHLHISIVPSESAKYTGTNGVSASGGSTDCPDKSPAPATDTKIPTTTSPLINLNIFEGIKAIAQTGGASASGSSDCAPASSTATSSSSASSVKKL